MTCTSKTHAEQHLISEYTPNSHFRPTQHHDVICAP